MILKVKNDLFDYPNRYIMQIKDGFKFSLDSLLLAEFTKLRQSDKLILDMCTGNAPVPLVLSLKTDAKIIGFELQRAIAELAWESISINGLDKQIKVINDDVKNIGEFFKPNTFDVITSVPGGNGTITPSILGVVEGTSVEITFTPDTGYMIDKVLVNNVETTVTGNKIELIVDEEKDVAVSYKKIPFTITVKDVAGATITPNGAVSVNYGDTQEFTITANNGYKLVKVLVDETDKTTDMVNNTLKLTNITSNINLEVVVERIVYEVTDGANQKYTITESDEAKFRINADFSKFVDGGKVYVDNELVDSKNYTAESGSTIITLKKAFVDKLSVGEHTLKVVFNDGGEASTMFNVARVEVLIDNPSTYDNILKYIGASIISVIGLVSVGIYSYRRKQN